MAGCAGLTHFSRESIELLLLLAPDLLAVFVLPADLGLGSPINNRDLLKASSSDGLQVLLTIDLCGSEQRQQADAKMTK